MNGSKLGGRTLHIKLNFLGASGNVTGARYLLEANNTRLLVDCGLYQEREFLKRNWEPFPFPAASLDAVLLTHAHVDHCGLIPKLVREGFRGRIYCTTATAEIARIILLDSAHLQEEDAEFKKKRHEREKRKGPYPELPLYTVPDAEASFPFFSPVPYGEVVVPGEGIRVDFNDAGHVLGSSMIRITVTQGQEKRTIVFSGDVGRWNRPILQDPSVFGEIDYLVMESTYGDRLHEKTADVGEKLSRIINETSKAGGNIIVPSFALQRSQEILYHLNQLLIKGRIAPIKVFLDSPMAVKITEVYRKHIEMLDNEMAQLLRQQKSPFEFPGLNLVQTAEESRAISQASGTVMIIAGSGMCNGGRIKYHLAANISRRESTILFVGFQAIGTLGRQIVDGAKQVRILGQTYRVRAKIAEIHGFSSHADRDELMRWLEGLRTAPRRVFVVHGESSAAHQFAAYLKENKGWEVTVPEYRSEVILD